MKPFIILAAAVILATCFVVGFQRPATPRATFGMPVTAGWTIIQDDQGWTAVKGEKVISTTDYNRMIQYIKNNQ